MRDPPPRFLKCNILVQEMIPPFYQERHHHPSVTALLPTRALTDCSRRQSSLSLVTPSGIMTTPPSTARPMHLSVRSNNTPIPFVHSVTSSGAVSPHIARRVLGQPPAALLGEGQPTTIANAMGAAGPPQRTHTTPSLPRQRRRSGRLVASRPRPAVTVAPPPRPTLRCTTTTRGPRHRSTTARRIPRRGRATRRRP